MRLICAWCQKNLTKENFSGNSWNVSQKISYGICPTCRNRFFPDTEDLQSKPKRKSEGD